MTIILCYPFLFSNCFASQYLHFDTVYTVDASNDDKEFKIVTLRVTLRVDLIWIRTLIDTTLRNTFTNT